MTIETPTTQLAGYFKIEAIDSRTGESRVLADWFPNLILDSGLNAMGSNTLSSLCLNCQVGTSNTAVDASQTGLVARIAGVARDVSQETHGTDTSGADYFGWSRRKYLLTPGTATGNLSEVAVALAATGNTFNRALILDDMGAPTTITVLSTDYLVVQYELRKYCPMADVVGSTNIGGQAHDYIIRASLAGSSWHPFGSDLSASRAFAYTGDIGAITSVPAGTSSFTDTTTPLAYGNNDLFRDGRIVWSLGQGNIGGVRSVLTVGSGNQFGRFQIQFDPTIAKDNTKILTINTRHAWARRTL